MAIFKRQFIHQLVCNIRRITENQVVPTIRQCCKQIGLDQPDSITYRVATGIYSRHCQCVRGNIDGIKSSLVQNQSKCDSDTTTPGTQVEHILHTSWIKPRFKTLRYPLTYVRARDYRTLIDVELGLCEPGAVKNIGQWLSAVDPFQDQFFCFRQLLY